MEMSKLNKFEYLEFVSKMTDIPKDIIEKVDKVMFDFSTHQVCSQLDNKTSEYSITLGTLGVLTIYKIDDNIVYDFVPFESFDNAIRDAIDKGEDRTTNTLEEELVNRLNDKFKELS